MTADQLDALISAIYGVGTVVIFALGYIGGHQQ